MRLSILTITALTLLVSACGKQEAAQTTSAPAAPKAPAATTTPAPAATATAPTAAPAPTAEKPAAPQPAPAAAEEPAKAAATAASAGKVLSREEGTALAKSSGCFACHDKEFKRRIIGPAWGDVAEKYRGKPDAHDVLVKWVHTGGTGRWGTAVMPPYSPRVPDNEIEKLVDFILSLPKPS